MNKRETISVRLDCLARTKPTACCYEYNGVQSTYAELKQKSDSLAMYLNHNHKAIQAKGAILIIGALEFEMVATFIGVVKAGYAYIPVDSHTPLDRLKQIISIAQPILIIDLSAGKDLGDLTVSIMNQTKALAIMNTIEAEELDLQQAVTGNENFYIIFTSGTTGAPKGVQISHDNLVSFTDWMLGDFNLPSSQRFLAQAPYSFDLSVMNLYPALLSGGTLVALEKAITNNFKQLFSLLPTLELNVWVSTPSFIDICLLDQNFSSCNYPSLRTFLFCGEELTNKTARLLLQRFPHAQIFNTYGPTEGTVAVTSILVTEDVLVAYPRLPIGKVKEDSKIILVDEDLRPVPAGEAGEMVIVGPSVSNGYLHNPTKTEAAFYQIDGVPAYRTGDLGRYEGELLFYQGRLDFQIKLHGYRIELEDIDHNIKQVSYVKAATVVPKLKEGKTQSLVAYVEVYPHDFPKEYQLTNAIKAELAPLIMDYMMPAKWVYVDHLPLTSNGKVDRKGLIEAVNP